MCVLKNETELDSTHNELFICSAVAQCKLHSSVTVCALDSSEPSVISNPSQTACGYLFKVVLQHCCNVNDSSCFYSAGHMVSIISCWRFFCFSFSVRSHNLTTVSLPPLLSVMWLFVGEIYHYYLTDKCMFTKRTYFRIAISATGAVARGDRQISIVNKCYSSADSLHTLQSSACSDRQRS